MGVKNIVNLMEELRENIIYQKKNMRLKLNELDKKIELCIADNNSERAELYKIAKKELLYDFEYLMSIDANNSLTYDVLGYHITGYQMRQKRLGMAL